MPHVLVGSLKAAEADADPQEPLTAPHVAGCDRGLAQLQSLTAIHQHLHRLLHVSLQQILQRVVVLVLNHTYTQSSSVTVTHSSTVTRSWLSSKDCYFK